MTRRKREMVGLTNERDYPHLVELTLPPGGFRSVLLGTIANTKLLAAETPRKSSIWPPSGHIFISKLCGDSARKRGARMALSLRDVRCDPIANRALNELMHHYTVAQEKSRLVDFA